MSPLNINIGVAYLRPLNIVLIQWEHQVMHH